MKLLNICNIHQNKLTPEERQESLAPLLSTGWIVQAQRDAIYKEFTFTNFNEVYIR